MNIKYIIIASLLALIISVFSTSLTAQELETSQEQLSEPMQKQRSETFMEANKQRILGNYDEAEKLYKKVLEIDADHDPSMYELARIYLRKSRAEDAILLMKKAISIDNRNVWYQLMMADLYKKTRQFNKVIEVFTKLTLQYPEKIDYYYDLALSYIIMGEYKEAIAVYDQLEEKLGITEDISLQKQRLYLNMDKSSKAVQEIEKLVEAHPYNSRYLQILAEAYMSHGKDDKALEIYEKIAEVDPQNPYIHISLSDYYRRQGNEQKAYEQLSVGLANPNLDLDSKIQVLLSFYSVDQFYNEKREQAYELARILKETHPDDTRALSIYGDLQYRSGELQPALETFNRILEGDSSQYAVWEQKMFILNELTRNKELAETSSAAMELFPMQPLTYLFNGFAHFQLKEYEAARKAMENGSKLVVDNNLLLAQFYSTLGDIYNELKEHTKSNEYYEKALSLKPDDAYVLNNYSYYLSLRNENLERAREMAAKANELDPGNPSFMDTYGWVLYKLGEYVEAEKWIKKALDHEEADGAVLLEHYGDVLYKLNRKEEAMKYWQKARDAGGEASEFLDEKIEKQTLVE
ncbi:MAG: tetratricopeptide repeat protein [Bacteroidales bacterium]